MGRALQLGWVLLAVAGCQVISPEHLKSPPFAPIDIGTANLDDEPLMKAAKSMEAGNDEAAAKHLLVHLQKNPDQTMFRAQVAEIMSKLSRLSDAQYQFEKMVASAQNGSPSARKQLVHGHTRLMEIAQERNDTYAERLNRGIGLYHVAEQLSRRDESELEAGEYQRVYCKAAAELREAEKLRPDDARPSWYLYLIWTKLDQPRPAEKALGKALSQAAFSTLTPAEQSDLQTVKSATR